ncbi:hypothetical protein BO85DRAFT_451431 [Aspergillus piperis CBS 112811]|uniref:Uncharacterized protein n=1 Tax=Aspergillus piperis CBS 112811 TaxID=1448313 RepID=A0A8G1QWE5_9EURO|nr:hypothetical protein BO85DRAFT_451431 [Aspergillus piperis CBS 112811]RAH55646.1 hypothetical protein BO85DRAFT_451431 [Aspergillus piperis CBS 112811]
MIPRKLITLPTGSLTLSHTQRERESFQIGLPRCLSINSQFSLAPDSSVPDRHPRAPLRLLRLGYVLVLCFATKTSSDLKQKKGAPKHTTVLNPGWILPRQ